MMQAYDADDKLRVWSALNMSTGVIYIWLFVPY